MAISQSQCWGKESWDTVLLLLVYLGHNYPNELKAGILLGRHEEIALYCKGVKQDNEVLFEDCLKKLA